MCHTGSIGSLGKHESLGEDLGQLGHLDTSYTFKSLKSLGTIGSLGARGTLGSLGSPEIFLGHLGHRSRPRSLQNFARGFQGCPSHSKHWGHMGRWAHMNRW